MSSVTSFYIFRDEADSKVGIPLSYTNKTAEPGVIGISNTNIALTEPYSDDVDEAWLQYSQTEMNNSEATENEETQNICLNETFDQSTQNNETTDVSIPHPYSLLSDDEVAANIRFLNVQQTQVFDFAYSWTKETVKQKGSVKPNLVKPFNLFLSASGGVG